jgi:hypothetical protein
MLSGATEFFPITSLVYAIATWMRWQTVSVGSSLIYHWRRETGMCGQNWEVRVGLVHDIFGVADGERKDRGVAAPLRVKFVEKVFVY